MKAAQSYVDAKKQADAIILQAKLLSEQSPAPSYTERPHPYSQWSNTSGVNLIPENIDTNLSPAPSPVPSPRAVENAQSISGRARSGSGSLTAKEFAAHGKRGFNAIRQRLAGDRENLQPEAQQAAMQNAQSKISKTKSETEQADAAYRKGVFEGESHRMQRERVQQSAVTSLIEFHDELNKVLRRSLTSYKDAVNATAATLAQSTGEIDAALIAIRPDPDTMLYRSVAPKPRTNPPLVYENFWHGPSHSLIFGVKLEDYENARGTGGDRGNPPLIVEKCIAELDIHLSTPGLYRLNGRDATVKDVSSSEKPSADAIAHSTN
jgi:hypothetical protein